MTEQAIPAEAVEAAAKVYVESFDSSQAVFSHDRKVVLEILTAAAPFLMAKAWDEGREANDFEVSIGMDRNPYRE